MFLNIKCPVCKSKLIEHSLTIHHCFSESHHYIISFTYEYIYVDKKLLIYSSFNDSTIIYFDLPPIKIPYVALYSLNFQNPILTCQKLIKLAFLI